MLTVSVFALNFYSPRLSGWWPWSIVNLKYTAAVSSNSNLRSSQKIEIEDDGYYFGLVTDDTADAIFVGLIISLGLMFYYRDIYAPFNTVHL